MKQANCTNRLIKSDVDTLMKSINFIGNILNVLNKIKSGVFDGVYLHFDDKSQNHKKVLQREQN